MVSALGGARMEALSCYSLKSSDAVGIDIGSTLLMVDAYRRGLIHNLSDQNLVIQRGLHRAGFLYGGLLK